MPGGSKDAVVMVEGSIDFSAGVDSVKVPTVQSAMNPNGLQRNQLAWLVNGTVRDGGVTQRAGWRILGRIHDGAALYQGGLMYEPDGANPYLLLSISGRIYAVQPDNPGGAVDLSAIGGYTNPPHIAQAFFVQAEQFAVIQGGNGMALPLFWDGTTLRRSKGITNTAVAPGTPGINEIPAATCMDYYQGRLWYAQNRQYSAGDIVGGNSGTLAYRFRDAVLNVTENPLVVGGDGFTVPTNAGSIRALKHSANLDATLGEGRLYIFTRKAVYSLSVPITRASWIKADNNNQPLQTVVQLVNGAVNDRSVVPTNGDLFYQSLEPGIRSLITAIRYFDQWGNTQVGNNENRVLQFSNRALLHMATGIEFDNRLWQSALPKQLPQGVVHQAILPLDFTPLSTFETTAPPAWEGMYEGLDILQMFTGDFGGLQRAFGVTVNKKDGGIELWEFSTEERFEGNDARVSWYMEFPAMTWGSITELKRLVGAELWVDRLYGQVVFELSYRPDGDPCWHTWHRWEQCSSRNSCEDVHNPVCYPISENRESFRATMTLPKPPVSCEGSSGRPSDLGYQFQTRLKVHGFCRIRGIYLYAERVERALYSNPVC